MDASIEVVMLTAYETIETARQALRYGASDYLNKPSIFHDAGGGIARRAKAPGRLGFPRTRQQFQMLQQEIAVQRIQEEMARAKGEIYASVLHDINSPLTVISGFVRSSTARCRMPRVSKASTREYQRRPQATPLAGRPLLRDLAALSKLSPRALEGKYLYRRPPDARRSPGSARAPSVCQGHHS
jgi:response regulator of citrate/malate metabolism